MNPLASCKVAIAALRVNALRSFLAMLGVIIGVASVIVMVSVATGAGQAIEVVRLAQWGGDCGKVVQYSPAAAEA